MRRGMNRSVRGLASVRSSLLAVAATAAVVALCGCQEVKEPTTTLTQAQWEEVKANILTEAPADLPFKVGAVFGDKVELIGLSVEPSSPKPGQEVTVTWWWRCLGEMDVNWQVFVHLDVTGKRPTRQGLDHHPVRDLYQTTRWQKGQIIKDVQKVQLRPDYPGGEATFWVGLWNPATNKRMPLTNPTAVKHDNDNRVNVATVTVDAPAAAAADPGERQRMVMVRQLQGELVIDGKLDEEAWQKAPRTARFGGTRGGPGPDGNSWARVLYDEQYLYVGLYGEDTDVWGDLKDRDSDTWTQEVFEVFIDPDGDAKDYVELQVTPNNVVFDARFPVKLGTGTGSQREQIDAARTWNSAMQTAVFVDGTVNDNSSPDKSWSVEMKIPFTDLPGGAPKIGATWKANFYRFDAPRGADGKPTGQVAWSWSPAHGFFHNVEHFGTLRFLGGPGSGLTPILPTPNVELPKVPVADPKSMIKDKREEVEADKPE